MITENIAKRMANGAVNAFVPIVFGVAAKAVVGAAAYAFKQTEFPEDSIVEKQLKKVRFFFAGTPNGLKKEIEIFQKRMKAAKNNFDFYKLKHEELLKQDLQGVINEINKNKVVVKECVLKNLADALVKIGIKSEVRDYPLEVLDYRDFPIHDEFDIIKNQQEDLVKIGKEVESFYIVLFPTLAIWNYLRDLKKLHKKSDAFRDKTNSVLDKMRHELKRMDELKIALDNISSIFKDLKDAYVPTIEEFTEDIVQKYNSYEEVPEDLLNFIRNCTHLLKEICEMRIVECGNLEKVKEYSDELTIRYCQLRTLLMSAA